MAISKDNVKSNFMELSGLDSTSAEVYAGLITVCADEMEKAVDQERMVAEGGTAICEFAAAAEVFYRFICLKAAEYKVMFTAQGKATEIFQFSGRIAPSDKAYAWAALSENGGKAINFTADGVLYSGYILSDIEMDFQPDRIIGSLMIKLRGAE